MIRLRGLSTAVIGAACVGIASPAAAADPVPRIAHDALLRHLAADGKLVFIDARERDEWAEQRLPGARHLPLREAVLPDALRSLPRDAVLVSYCIKDFRGYEVARALRRAGYDARVMDDPGLQGWKKAKLPTAGEVPAVGDAHAWQALRARATR